MDWRSKWFDNRWFGRVWGYRSGSCGALLTLQEMALWDMEDALTRPKGARN